MVPGNFCPTQDKQRRRKQKYEMVCCTRSSGLRIPLKENHWLVGLFVWRGRK